MQAGGPFADIEGLEKSSSDGLVKEVLIWLHRALILLSPSPGNPMSISSTSKKEKHRGRRGGGEESMKRRDGTREEEDKQRERGKNINLFESRRRQ